MLNKNYNEEDKQKITINQNPIHAISLNKNNPFSQILTKTIKNTLFIRKLDRNDLILNNSIQNSLNSYFNSTDNFFDKNSPISVNKKIFISDIDFFSRKYERKGTRFRTSKIQSLSNIDFKRRASRRFSTNFTKNNPENVSTNKPEKFEFIDNEKLRYIFNSYKILNKNDLGIYNNLNAHSRTMKTLPKDISQSLSLQTKRLETKNIIDKSNQKMSKFLMKRTNKNENDLLLNNIDSYRYKKEIINQIEKKDHFKRNYGNLNLNWNINLRRPEKIKKGERYKAFINISNDSTPFWAIIDEKSPCENEISVKPGFDLNNKKCSEFKKNVENKLKNILPYNIKSIENLDRLNVTGKDLFNIEYNREMNNKKRKILHKSFLIDNGKVILDDDINKVFGDKTIYKKYKHERMTTFPSLNH